MCVEQVKSLYLCLKSAVKHFSTSCKSKEQLDRAMAVLDMKEVHILSWSATRMAHSLESCVHFNVILVSVYCTMYSCNLKKEERDNLFTADHLFVMKLVTDLKDKFYINYLRKVEDQFAGVDHLQYCTKCSQGIINIETPRAEKFCNSLKVDDNDNLIVMESEEHELLLSNYHKGNRNVSEAERVQKLQEKLQSIKEEILKNIEENIKDQCGQDTNYFLWSVLDLSNKS